MTCKTDSTQFDVVMELLIEDGFDGIADTIGVLMNSAMSIERSRHLHAKPYERSVERRGYANGYKSKTMHTRIGEANLAIPQLLHCQTFTVGYYGFMLGASTCKKLCW